jgi:hypothetical protein
MLAEAMGFEPVREYDFEVATDSYVGSDYGKAASWQIDKDTIYLARNDLLDGMVTCRFETLEVSSCFDSVYLTDADEELDPYDVFLGGLGPIVVITNERVQSGEQLFLFKDSYAHALAPFLAQHFARVTLFDMRFVRRQLILDNFDFERSKVLFLYSTSVLNTDAQILN